ncbi:hypothetical protein ACIRPK_23530 [Kitasatospora sp. NPDC101801]
MLSTDAAPSRSRSARSATGRARFTDSTNAANARAFRHRTRYSAP